MRGRGIGTARGRATIMRGAFLLVIINFRLTLLQQTVRASRAWTFGRVLMPFSPFLARRGRGGPPAGAPRGIRR